MCRREVGAMRVTVDASASEPAQSSVLVPAAAPARVAPYGESAARRRTWRVLAECLKGMVILLEVAALVFLAYYSGSITLLPRVPPAAHFSAGSGSVTAPALAYCWLTPGRSQCLDGLGSGEQAGAKVVSSLTVTRGQDVRVAFSYPAPAACSATATLTGTEQAPRPLDALMSVGNAALRLPVALDPGTYALTLACQWNAREDLRWLDGQGSATYEVRVTVPV